MKDKIYNIISFIEPAARGIIAFLFAIFLNIHYNDFITPDNGGIYEIVPLIFYLIDKLGGRFLLLGIFIFIGLLLITHDYHKKFGKKGNES
jgi:hypothetical protein